MTVPVARSVEAIPVEPCLIAEVTPVVSKFESAKIGEVALSEPVQACLETWTQQVLSVQRDAVNPYNGLYKRPRRQDAANTRTKGV